MPIVEPRVLSDCCTWVLKPGASCLRSTYPSRVASRSPVHRSVPFRRVWFAASSKQTPSGRTPLRSFATASSSSGSRILRTQDPMVAATPTVKPAQQLQSMPMPTNDSTVRLVLDGGAVQTEDGIQFLEALPACMFRNNPAAESSILLGASTDAGPVSFMDVSLGQLSVRRFLACARHKLWWMTPEWGTDIHHMPPETQFLLMELREGGPYVIMLPLICGGFRATVRRFRGPKGAMSLGLRVESGDDTVKAERWDSMLYIAASRDPYSLIDAAVANAGKVSGGAQARTKKALPPSLDVFGWCTWDAFYSTVSAKGLREGISSLRAGGVPPGLLIIDDGWQLTDVDPPVVKPPVSQLVDTVPVPKQIKSAAEESVEEFYHGAGEVLAEAAKDMPSGTSAATSMPTLAGVGPAPHHPMESVDAPRQLEPTDDSPRQQRVNLLMVVVQKIIGWIIGLGTAAVLLFYQFVVEPAPAGSLPVRLFEWIATGPLRGGMLAFYATASDFTRRLVSTQANGKFASVDAGPDEDWKVKGARLDLVVSNMKSNYGVKYVYCWHGLPAYWAGVMPNSELGQRYNARILFAKPTPGVLEIEPSMAWNPAVLGGIGVVDDPNTLYRDMHEYLSGCGVDGVKVDCQAGVGLIGSAMGGGPALSAKFHEALEDSARRFFSGNHVINCMCHSTENLYRMTRSAVARASDDFYPRDEASSLPHVGACAFNSLFLAALVQPDWDMFQSKHPAAVLHAMARAVSGGAVYVSDRPGEHDFELLKRLVLPDGTVLRASAPGRPTLDCIFSDVLRDGRSLLKVWTTNPLAGVVGVFNLQGSSWDRSRRRFWVHQKHVPELSTDVRATDVHTFSGSEAAGRPFAVFQCSSSRLQVVADAHEPVAVTVAQSHSDIVTFAPVTQLPGLSFAPVGLMHMYNCSGAILSSSWHRAPLKPFLRAPQADAPPQLPAAPTTAATATAPTSGSSNGTQPPAAEEAVVVTLDVKGCGDFLMWCDRAPRVVVMDGVRLKPHYGAEEGRLVFTLPETETVQCQVQVVFADTAAQ